MKRLLSPGLLWPLFIVALLLMSVAMSVRAVVASRSDGGAEPVPDYYAQAAGYDAQARAQATSERLGWRAEVVPGTVERSGLRALTLRLTDADGQPVADLAGEVLLGRPSRIDTLATVPFGAEGSGHYRALVPMPQPGLWDVTVRARRGDARFSQTIRVEVF